ncbi:phosphatase PAP2 family protein [Sphingomonas sp. BN140010]|uniref:Phosphatase PAP2 family protein n=1 Tax=Sphingomonas arvum TaxID=2992113 RepID=A0ABT3JJC2_9SPHN|nr:phosphatase PAP2 family protein [Sphingomonas sp. BN140010]MCW3798850.1 phosphatase PAP2 family protein [Sphingomonas sp. BN140010]
MDDAVRFYRRATRTLALVSLGLALTMIATSDVRLQISAGSSMLATTVLAMVIGVVPLPIGDRMKDAGAALGDIWLGGLACGFISLLGLRWHLPLADAALLQADRSIGLDSASYAEWIGHRPSGFQMGITGAYNLTTPILFVSMAAAALLGRRVVLWRAACSFMGSLLTVCVISVMTPAKGIGVWVSSETLALLPPGAMTYFWPSFEQFYRAATPVLSFDAIDGVVSFPSFHVIMGLIGVGLWRDRPVTFALASGWFGLMLMATIPLGGHYAVDLLGGALIWAGWHLGLPRLLRLDLSSPAWRSGRTVEGAVLAA